jgi:glycosyltransferase involved in cell wall biosynthesis
VKSASLIIATYNWETALDLVLASVHAQSTPPGEVIVADDGSGPATQEVVERWIRRLTVPLRHVWQEDRGFRLAASRNRALAVTRGEYVLMIDGDMLLHEKFVQSHLAFARRGTYVHFLAPGIGNRINAIHLPALARLHRGARGPIDRTRGANMAFWIADIRRVNGFNEDIEGWGYEDIEFAARLQNAGVVRRNLKFGGVAYHLHHRLKPEDPHANRDHFERVMREGVTWCPNGLDKYGEGAGSETAHDARSNR